MMNTVLASAVSLAGLDKWGGLRRGTIGDGTRRRIEREALASKARVEQYKDTPEHTPNNRCIARIYRDAV